EQTNLLRVHLRIDLLLDLVLEYVNDREPQRDSCERAHICRVARGHGLTGDLERFGVGGAEDDDQIVAPETVSNRLDLSLAFRVHRSSSRSDEALREGEHDLGSGRRETRRDRLSGDPVTLAERDRLATVESHSPPPCCRSRATAASMAHSPDDLQAPQPASGTSRMIDAPSHSFVMRPRNRLPLATSIVECSSPV